MKFGAGVVVVDNLGRPVAFEVPVDGSVTFSAIALTVKTSKISFSFISLQALKLQFRFLCFASFFTIIDQFVSLGCERS